MLEVTFNVTSLEDTVDIGVTQFKTIEIDGKVYMDPSTIEEELYQWQFDTLGKHVVKYELSNPQSAEMNGYNPNVVEVKIPEGVKYLGQWFCTNCTNLTAVTIPSSLEDFGMRSFYDCTSLPVEGNIRYADTIAVQTLDKTQSTYTLKEGTRYLTQWLFSGATNLTAIELPDTLDPHGIGPQVFKGCTSLTNIVIPKQVKILDNSEFEGCTALTSVTFENGSELERLRGAAFYNCSSLQHLEFPSTLYQLWNAEFDGCTSLVDITFNSVVPPELHDNRIITSNQTFTIYVPAQSVDAYKTADRWSVAANRIQAI